MNCTDDPISFSQIHIEVARNATDDFNPFHDKYRWQNVANNPFGGPIALGFQLECLIAERLRLFRNQTDDNDLTINSKARFSNYELKFVGAVRAEQEVLIEIGEGKSRNSSDDCISNRVRLLAAGRLAVTGYHSQSVTPGRFAEPNPFKNFDLDAKADKTYLEDSNTFLKRKYITTSNAKNFLCGSLVDQAQYIDEIDNKVNFPEIYPCALLSSALLEQATLDGHDFEKEPMVYKSHNICIDRNVQEQLHSNDVLHLLTQRSGTRGNINGYKCYGVVKENRLLFSGRIDLVPLHPT